MELGYLLLSTRFDLARSKIGITSAKIVGFKKFLDALAALNHRYNYSRERDWKLRFLHLINTYHPRCAGNVPEAPPITNLF